MDARYREDGDPYGPTERRPPLVKPWVWAVMATAAIGGIAYAAWPRHWAPVPVIDEQSAVTIPTPVWNGYQSAHAPKLQQAPLEPDTRYDALERQVRAMQAEDAKLREMLQHLQHRPVPEPQKTQTATATPAPKPARPRHRDMGASFFAQEEAKTAEEPLYVLAPGDAKLTCIVESHIISDVESIATVKISTNLFDSQTRRFLLIPQGSTILTRYASANLLYGDARLPVFSTTLTLPNGTTHKLDDEPVLTQDGTAGLASRVDSHFWRAVPAVLIQGILRGTQQTITSAHPLAAGVAGSANQYGQKVVTPFINLKPTIHVDAGEPCTVILTKPLKLPVYTEGRNASR